MKSLARVACPLVMSMALVSTGCQLEDLGPAGDEAGRELVGETARPIIGGNEVSSTSKWPYVVRLDIGGTCTGTLVRPNVILTAAHCVEGFFGGRARFGTGPGNWIQDPDGGGDLAIELEEAVIHRAFGGFIEKDIALIRMAQDAPDIIQPIDFNLDPLDESFIGVEVTTVGFGNNIPPTGGPETGQGAGKMREVVYAVDGVTAEHIKVGDQTENTCQGDSGGPTFAMLNGELKVIAVTSFGTFQCQGQSSLARTDVYADDFLLETIAAWNGPCSLDGECNDSGECEYIDPDCDVCGFDGICGQDCENVDLDCPLGGLPGDTCEDAYDCETRLCVTAPDDERVKYCSQPCDESRSASTQCQVPLATCGKDPEGSESVCQFGGPTPGTQGAACTDSAECLGACDPNEGICVEICSSNADCAAEFECRSVGGTKVCTTPSEGGCAAGHGGAANLAFAGLGLLGMLAFRRRRQ